MWQRWPGRQAAQGLSPRTGCPQSPAGPLSGACGAVLPWGWLRAPAAGTVGVGASGPRQFRIIPLLAHDVFRGLGVFRLELKLGSGSINIF